MCGRYLGHDAADRNVPTARFGNVSLMADQTRPVRDGRRLEVEAHLVEMRSQAGFSGSPVFVIIPADSFRGEFNYRPEDPDYRTLTRFRCIGIDTGHKRELLPVIDPVTGERRDDVVVQANSGVAIVAPIRKVIDLLNSPALVAERNVVAKAWRTANPDA
jgi:hypothetical protein